MSPPQVHAEHVPFVDIGKERRHYRIFDIFFIRKMSFRDMRLRTGLNLETFLKQRQAVC